MHSDTIYIDQSPDALRLTINEGDLDRSQFQLLSEQNCSLAGITISAAVIGASHIVSYDTGAFRLNEIFACTGLENVSAWSLAELVKTPIVRQYPGFCYEFRVERVPWSDPEPARLTKMVRAASSSRNLEAIRLVVDFPSGGLSVTPKTVVIGDASKGAIRFTTAHSYPNVRGLVISHSVLSRT